MNLMKAGNRRFICKIGVFVVVFCAGWGFTAGAQVILSDPELPPESDPMDCESVLSAYAASGLYAVYPGPIGMSNPRLYCFQNVLRQTVGIDELETFDSVWDASLDLGLGSLDISLIGPASTLVFGRTLSTSGLFDTEMVSMSLSGNVGGINIQIRESPTLASLGQTDITDLGGGLYQIDSFFDIYTEMSLDGGPWLPQNNQAMRMVLVEAATVPVSSATWGAVKALYH